MDALVLRDSAAANATLTANGTPGTRLWPVQDANWNVAAVANGNGTVAERYEYTAFGVATVLSPTYGSRTSSSYGWQYEFQGLRYDAATGLYDARNREMSATLGRPIQSDMLGLVPDINSYRWEYGNPAHCIDPSGLQPPANNAPSENSRPVTLGIPTDSQGRPLTLYRPEVKPLSIGAVTGYPIPKPSPLPIIPADASCNYINFHDIKFKPFPNHLSNAMSSVSKPNYPTTYDPWWADPNNHGFPTTTGLPYWQNIQGQPLTPVPFPSQPNVGVPNGGLETIPFSSIRPNGEIFNTDGTFIIGNIFNNNADNIVIGVGISGAYGQGSIINIISPKPVRPPIPLIP